jgi:molybdate transport repressor ModE-like protein
MTNDLEVRHCRVLVAVSEHGSVSAAARELKLAQSTISETLLSLERVIGAPIMLRRPGKEAALTVAAETLLPHARALVAASEAAQALVNGAGPYLNGRFSLITLDGHILASSDTPQDGAETPLIELPDISDVHQGEVVELRNGPLAEAIAPVYDLRGREIGVVRMTTVLVTVSEEIYQLRYLLGFVLLLAVLAGLGLGSYLAINLNRPIQRVTRSIQELAQGDWRAHVECAISIHAASGYSKRPHPLGAHSSKAHGHNSRTARRQLRPADARPRKQRRHRSRCGFAPRREFAGR